VRDVACWHFSDVLRQSSDVRCWRVNRPKSAAPEDGLLTHIGKWSHPIKGADVVRTLPLSSSGMEPRMIIKRRRVRQTKSLQERLAEEAKQLLKVAETLPPGPKRDAVLLKARQNETALHVTDWLNSPDPEPPT